MAAALYMSDDSVRVVGTPMLPNKPLQPSAQGAAAELVRRAGKGSLK
jgi:hypothetical protein